MERASCAKSKRIETSIMGELDQIVVQVFEALNARPTFEDESEAEPKPQTFAKLHKNKKPANGVIHRQAWPAAPPAEVGGEPEPVSTAAGRPSPRVAETELRPAAEEPSRDNPGLSLLTSEEEEFVARSVQWLDNHSNPDILLDRIWTLVIEAKSSGQRESADETDAEPEASDAPGASNED